MLQPSSNKFVLTPEVKLELGDKIHFGAGELAERDGSTVINRDHYRNNGHEWTSYTFLSPSSLRWWMTVSAEMANSCNTSGIYVWSEISEEQYRWKVSEAAGTLQPIEIMSGEPSFKTVGPSLQLPDARCQLTVHKRPDGTLLSKEEFRRGSDEPTRLWFEAQPIEPPKVVRTPG